jgi:hypothetical protein
MEHRSIIQVAARVRFQVIWDLCWTKWYWSTYSPFLLPVLILPTASHSLCYASSHLSCKLSVETASLSIYFVGPWPLFSFFNPIHSR